MKVFFYILMDLISTDGHWEPWTEWGDCSHSCGTGLRSRDRTCADGGIVGHSCVGANVQSELCEGVNCSGTVTFVFVLQTRYVDYIYNSVMVGLRHLRLLPIQCRA